jgi:hypothetical protein
LKWILFDLHLTHSIAKSCVCMRDWDCPATEHTKTPSEMSRHSHASARVRSTGRLGRLEEVLQGAEPPVNVGDVLGGVVRRLCSEWVHALLAKGRARMAEVLVAGVFVAGVLVARRPRCQGGTRHVLCALDVRLAGFRRVVGGGAGGGFRRAACARSRLAALLRPPLRQRRAGREAALRARGSVTVAGRRAAPSSSIWCGPPLPLLPRGLQKRLACRALERRQRGAGIARRRAAALRGRRPGARGAASRRSSPGRDAAAGGGGGLRGLRPCARVGHGGLLRA